MESSRPTLDYLQSELKAGLESLVRPCHEMKATEGNKCIAVMAGLLPNCWVLGPNPPLPSTYEKPNDTCQITELYMDPSTFPCFILLL